MLVLALGTLLPVLEALLLVQVAIEALRLVRGTLLLVRYFGLGTLLFMLGATTYCFPFPLLFLSHPFPWLYCSQGVKCPVTEGSLGNFMNLPLIR